MIQAALATLIIAVILAMSEYLWRRLRIRGEFARKFVHIIAGCFIAFLPFWMTYGWITVLAVGFIAANLLNRYTPLFHAIHAITRKSWGDLLFGFGILGSALIKPNRWLFAGAILQVALADGLAAVIGTHYGKKQYKVMDHVKSPVGTATYYVSSLLILAFILMFGDLGGHNVLVVICVVPLAMTLLENISGFGSDNVSLPLGFLLLVSIMRI